VPLKQLHSYDYGGPYAGFRGAVNFYADIARMVGSRVWKLVGAPWENPGTLSARYVRNDERSE
jgi:nitrogenase molybdenum-iron protein alpha chain